MSEEQLETGAEESSAPDNFLEMSDEQILAMDEPSFEEAPAESAESEAVAEDSVDDPADETDDPTGSEEEPEGEEPGEGDPDEEGEADEDGDTGEEEEKDSPTNSEELLAQLYAPFKANGREMKVDNIDDARQLMQMGANYNKKMAAMKPHLKVIKMLDNNGLLEEGKLSYLIDLDKKNPQAIAKLLKESGVDPLDVDVEKATEYKPNTYTVDDREVELDQVLEEISESPKFQDTLETINTKWDAASKQTLVSNPRAIAVINEHMENGIYAQITAEVDRQRMLGRLDGVSDLAAYQQIGDQMHAEGKFTAGEQKPTPNATAPKPKTVTGKKPDPKLSERKRAAAVTSQKPTKKKGVPDDFNPLAMSDEEFEKSFSQKFL